MSTTIHHDAADKKRGMTLDELGQFVTQAARMDVDGDRIIKVTTGWRQQITALEVTSR